MTRVIDLTMEDDDEVKKDKGLLEEDDDLFILESSVIPFINYTRVPENFIPICPTATQSFQSNCEVAEKHLYRKLNHLLVTDALGALDTSTRKVSTLKVDEMDLEREVLNSGKLYFLTKLLESIAINKKLTDITLLVLTADAVTEKLLFRVFNELYGYPCARMSAAEQKFVMRANNNHSGAQFGVIIRLMAGPARAPYLVHQNYDLCALALVEYILVFDGEALPNYRRVNELNKFKFSEEPSVLDLCTIGTSEFRFKEFLSLSTAYERSSMEIIIRHATKEMKCRFLGHNTPFSSIDFLNWNNLIAKQVADWIIEGDTENYNFTFPLVRDEDVLPERQ